MYGEEVPHEELFYHSTDFWRICGVNFRVMDDEVFVEEVRRRPKMVCGSCRGRMGRWRCYNGGDGGECIHCEKERVFDGRTERCVYDMDVPWDDERWFE